MITDQTLNYLVNKLNDQRKDLVDFISQGSVKDFSEYQKICGVIQGLDTAKQIITDLADRMENTEDE
jgi:hypothetical protein